MNMTYVTFCGSSPLARGLPRTSPWACRAGRIIPARAGFTVITGADVAYARIIPARAGFTPRLRGDHRRRRDHPRSRGVYRPTRADDMFAGGSSPLARGLRLSSRERLPEVVDHPRSRGVYWQLVMVWSGGDGSSPLARGLPSIHRLKWISSGIIPARAGFTTNARPVRALCRDHPRSRGVYHLGVRLRPQPGGSSPLARGLHLRIVGIPTNP